MAGMKVCNMLKKFAPTSIFKSTTSMQLKNYSYQASKFAEDVEINTKYEAFKNPEEWKFVERILPPVLVPEPQPKAEYPSGWKPQGENFNDSPYFIRRTRNHMIPVYLIVRQRGIVRVTILRHIQGDIWQLEKDLRPFLEDIHKPRHLRMQVNEFRGHIVISGDFVNAIKHWLSERNL